MERIASFTVNHNTLVPGLYLSRRDGDIVTLDLRFKKPNTGDLLSNSELHSTEHLIATLLRPGLVSGAPFILYNLKLSAKASRAEVRLFLHFPTSPFLWFLGMFAVH